MFSSRLALSLPQVVTFSDGSTITQNSVPTTLSYTTPDTGYDYAACYYSQLHAWSEYGSSSLK